MYRSRIGYYALLRKALLVLVISLAMWPNMASNATLSFQTEDTYTQHLRIMGKFYRVFNPDMPLKDIENLCWATWRGCGNDQQAALWLSMVQALERNFKPETDITNRVQGYSGQYWHVLIKAAKEHGMVRPRVGWRTYFLAHPYEAEYHIARWFKETFYDNRGAWETLAIWHRGSNWRDETTWVKDVDIYRRNIVRIYHKYYLPTAKKVYPTPPELRLAQEDIGPPQKSLLGVLVGQLDFSTRID